MKNKKSSNYLDKIPYRNSRIGWDRDDNGIITLSIENKGMLKRATQLILGKPKISYVHLDEMGSFVWPLIDGKRDIASIGEIIKSEQGESEYLYQRLVKFFQILHSYGFVMWKK